MILNFISIQNNNGSMIAQLERQLTRDFTIIVPLHQQTNVNFSCDHDVKYNCGIQPIYYSKDTIGTFPTGKGSSLSPFLFTHTHTVQTLMPKIFKIASFKVRLKCYITK
jgi:hypothetical protein